MTTRLTQSIVNGVRETHAPGVQLYDDQAKGLRIVVGKTSASWKFVSRINDGSGRYVSVMLGKTTDVSLRSARDAAVDLKQQMRKGIDPRRPRSKIPSFLEAFERYLKDRPDLQPSSVEWYRKGMRGPLKPLVKLPVDKVDPVTVHELHGKITKKSGASMANGAMRILRAVLNDAARTHDLPPNPVTRGVRMHPQRPRNWAVPPSEMPELWRRLDAMEDIVRRGCWLTLLLTGLRSNDVRSMKWENLDDDGVLTVPSPKGGEGRAFKLPLPRILLQELESVRDYTRPLESEFVFPSTSKRGYIQTLKRLKSWPHPPHSLRHTWMTMSLEAGLSMEMSKLLLNHKSTDVTWGYITRDNLLGPMRDSTEATATKILSFRGVR
ncbi:MAG: integrase family protein [Pseudomonadota bacterium]